MQGKENNLRTKYKAKTLSVLAAVLSFVLLLTLFPVTALAVDPDAPVSLAIYSVASTSEYAEDVAKTQVAVDLYKLASAVPMEGSDGYGYSFDPLYEGITIGDITMADLYTGTVSLTADQWNELAQQAAAIAMNGAPKAAEDVPVGERVNNLSSGLYLIIARGADIGDYWSELEGESGSEGIVTVAKTDNFIYSFAPSVIALPTKNAASDDSGEMIRNEAGMPDIRSDGSYGDWIYDASAYLKPEVTPRYGGITIVKTIDEFRGNEEVTFIFQIRATGSFPDEEEYKYSNVAAIAFNASTGLESRAVLDRIRAGANVEVKEIYTGLRYNPGPVVPESGVIVADTTEELVFEASNTFSSDIPGGHGIQNHFTNVKSENGTRWDVMQQTAASGLNR